MVFWNLELIYRSRISILCPTDLTCPTTCLFINIVFYWNTVHHLSFYKYSFLLEHRFTSIHLHMIYGLLHTSKGEVSSCNRD